VFNKLWQYSTKAFFINISQSFEVFLKTNTNVSPCLLRFVSVYKYHPSCPTTPAWLPIEILTNLCPTQNRPSSPLEDYCFSALLLSLGSSRVKTGVCERVYKQHVHHCRPTYRPATGHSSGGIRALSGSRPVNSRPAKRPGCVNTPILSCVPLLRPAISGTCRPGENRNV
jgi:hypothetical protein